MPKSKKAAKEKDLKSLKEEKPAKEKKDKKAKAATPAPKAAKTSKKATAVAPTVSEAIVSPVTKILKTVKKAVGDNAVTISFSVEELSLRAYFIAERRQAMGWPGDSTSDWAEAERQLQAEAKKTKR